jgi:hypothetical protein
LLMLVFYRYACQGILLQVVSFYTYNVVYIIQHCCKHIRPIKQLFDLKLSLVIKTM